MSIVKTLSKSGKSRRRRRVSEFLHLSSACIVNTTVPDRIEVCLYDIVGYREDTLKYFEDIRSYTEYLEFRRRRIENNYQWRKRIELREKRMRLDYFIRQKKPRVTTNETLE